MCKTKNLLSPSSKQKNKTPPIPISISPYLLYNINGLLPARAPHPPPQNPNPPPEPQKHKGNINSFIVSFLIKCAYGYHIEITLYFLVMYFRGKIIRGVGREIKVVQCAEGFDWGESCCCGVEGWRDQCLLLLRGRRRKDCCQRGVSWTKGEKGR